MAGSGGLPPRLWVPKHVGFASWWRFQLFTAWVLPAREWLGIRLRFELTKTWDFISHGRLTLRLGCYLLCDLPLVLNRLGRRHVDTQGQQSRDQKPEASKGEEGDLVRARLQLV